MIDRFADGDFASSEVYVYGASGHGKVVADILQCCGIRVAGFIDDVLPAGQRLLGEIAVAGSGEWLRARARDSSVAVALGIGTNNHARARVADQLSRAGIQLVTAVHPRATVAESAEIGAGSVIMAGAVVNADVRIGEGVVINSAAVIEHDAVIEDFVFIAPHATIAGGARVGKLSLVGIGAAVLPMVIVGSETIVGAGAVVARDLPDGVVASGVPARVRRSVHEEISARSR